jgi:hypothetical protein
VLRVRPFVLGHVKPIEAEQPQHAAYPRPDDLAPTLPMPAMSASVLIEHQARELTRLRIREVSLTERNERLEQSCADYEDLIGNLHAELRRREDVLASDAPDTSGCRGCQAHKTRSSALQRELKELRKQLMRAQLGAHRDA